MIITGARPHTVVVFIKGRLLCLRASTCVSSELKDFLCLRSQLKTETCKTEQREWGARAFFWGGGLSRQMSEG